MHNNTIIKCDDWKGLYSGSWRNEIVPEAFSHPAKFSRYLIRHIYKHMAEEGWIKRNDVIIDCFGGVALGALDAMKHGCAWLGCELEPRFVDLGAQNIEVWRGKYAPHFSGWGTARLVQGDSRRLLEVIGDAGLCAAVSSPPYHDARIDGNGDEGSSRLRDDDGNYLRGADGWAKRKEMGARYGNSPGNLGNMRGSAAGLEAAVSSPPYAESIGNADKSGIDWGKQADRETDHSHGWNGETYGSTPGQLGAMPARGFEASVSSPPYDEGLGHGMRKVRQIDIDKSLSMANGSLSYGETEGQLAGSSDFWTAARQIVDQVYAALAPGGHAVWVTKRFVKDKAIVEFTQQWAQMCEAAGFKLLHHHRAWLVEDKGTQYDLTGAPITKQTKRYSFFRRLHAQKYPELEIQWEDVLCMEK